MALDLLLGCFCGLDVNTKDIFRDTQCAEIWHQNCICGQDQNLPLGTCLYCTLLFCGCGGSLVLENFWDKDLVRAQKNGHRFCLHYEMARQAKVFTALSSLVEVSEWLVSTISHRFTIRNPWNLTVFDWL